MSRPARSVLPGFPHHVTQRGNRRQQTFFQPSDYRHYVGLVAEFCLRHGVEVWAWCVMPNHAHFVLVPSDPGGLRRALGEPHRRYALEINRREGWRGHLWQARFFSNVMDERYLLETARYVELNPVRAGLVARPEDYPWSSARAHLAGVDDGFVRVAPLLERVPDWAGFLGFGSTGEVLEAVRLHQRTGRPLGDGAFVESVEGRLGRRLRAGRRGRRPVLMPGRSDDLRMLSPI